MTDELLEGLNQDMDATIVSLQHDLARIRAGRANPGLLDSIRVDYYGVETALNKLATVSAPEARLLLVQPFDQGVMGAIEKAIQQSQLGLSSGNDGRVIRIPIPELTEERRRDLVKQARKEAEAHRVSARNHRRDANDMLKSLLAEKEISEDEMHTVHDEIQKITDGCVKRIDETVKAKEEEIMAV